MAELILRFAQDDTDPDLFDITAQALDRVCDAGGDLARDAAIAGSWRILAALGFEPSLDQCAECQRDIGDEETVLFSHASGGVICDQCAGGRAGRRLPPGARTALRDWLIGDPSPNARNYRPPPPRLINGCFASSSSSISPTVGP